VIVGVGVRVGVWVRVAVFDAVKVFVGVGEFVAVGAVRLREPTTSHTPSNVSVAVNVPSRP
jgi:hypothetical protein